MDWEAEAQRWFGLAMPDITYISYESLRLMDKATRRPRHWQFCGLRNGGDVYDVIADECHALKNPQAKQSKAIYEITRSGGLFIGLSGTPMPNGWIDFAGYSKLFNFTNGITEFKNKYCRIQDFKGFPEIIGYNNIPDLEWQLRRVAFKLDRNQAAELPSRLMLGEQIKLAPKASKLYHELKITRQDPRTGELLDTAPRLLSVLRQSTTNGRLDSLLSIVNDTSDNIVVFYNYISERKAILKLLAKTDKKILRYDGEKHDKLPASDADISNTILVAHYKSASTGLNLQWANVTIYFSPTYSYQEFEQSVGRTHRHGQTKKCLYYLFSVKGTVDRDIWYCLREKKDFNEKLWEAQEDEAEN
jgi:SNF2 family DNA or RNA helicase